MRSLGPYLVVLFVLIQVVRAILSANKKSTDHEQQHDETEEQRRMREIQERIRKKIAERRGGAAAPMAPPPPQPTSAAPRPFTMSPPPVVREPPRRIVVESAPAFDAAVLARQEQLAVQMRELEVARAAQMKRADHIAAEKTAATAVTAAAQARAAWLTDLRDPQNLRRAIVLREVLGTPVGLR